MQISQTVTHFKIIQKLKKKLILYHHQSHQKSLSISVLDSSQAHMVDKFSEVLIFA